MNTHPSINIQGSIISPDLIERIEEATFQNPESFELSRKENVRDAIGQAWRDCCFYWQGFKSRLENLDEAKDSNAVQITRKFWIIRLLETLGYNIEYQRADLIVNERKFRISHIQSDRAGTPIQIIGYNDPAGLDKKLPQQHMSAHAIVQEYLNLNDDVLYGIVTNGHFLRLLRDNSRLVKLSYLEFDLDRIFNDNIYADFAILFRLLHVTRLPKGSEDQDTCIIEQYHQNSLEDGARIRDNLSEAVKNAIEILANGFLKHPKNSDFRELVFTRRNNDEKYQHDFYTKILRLIYRLLFLMVIEERDLVYPKDTPQNIKDVYRKYYSVRRLRDISEDQFLATDDYSDLWLSLLSTFQLFSEEGNGQKLDIKPLAGDLFSTDAIDIFDGCELSNKDLLTALRHLSYYVSSDTNQLTRVNYAALNVEEFGSVYEGLLEYEASIIGSDQNSLTFTLNTGSERGDTGSHYTPEELVKPLIEHSLEYLIKERKNDQNPEQALLSLRVADIACGSGHILLSAARHIALALASVRTGEEQPNPEAIREALHDVIKECIYGVDLNPLAVELCKVALWLEAHTPGEPLSFLDHHIKCGNSIVGLQNYKELENGVPNEAFKALPTDDREIATELRKRNDRERRTKRFDLQYPSDGRMSKDFLDEFQKINNLPDKTPQEIKAKAKAYQNFVNSSDYFYLNTLVSIPIAQFYIAKTSASFGTINHKIITDNDFRSYLAGTKILQGQEEGAVQALAVRKKFFHWFLEFPEIIANGGFDCILGNPPYLGKRKISGTFGYEFCNYATYYYAPAGLSDLVVFFVQRIFNLLKPNGIASFITTNSIKDGDVRRDGLEVVVNNGANINMACRSIKWPGRANLYVTLLALSRRTNLDRFIDGRRVSNIIPLLEEASDYDEPHQLEENFNKIFQGCIFLGDGFLLTNAKVEELLKKDERNKKVIFKELNGKVINSEPDQAPQRGIINFHDWPLEKAKEYPLPFKIVEELVKPERAKKKNEKNRRLWWIYDRCRPELTNALSQLKNCFIATFATKYLNFSKMPSNYVFTNTIYVFTTDRFDLYSIVQSTIHEIWARKYSGYIGNGLHYSPTDCFANFPFPKGLWEKDNLELARIGQEYHDFRKSLMLKMWLGLTDIYNLFHDKNLDGAIVDYFNRRERLRSDVKPQYLDDFNALTLEEAKAGIEKLRALHVKLDKAVLSAYGWDDLDLAHDFYEIDTLPENDRIRYTIAPEVKRILLDRLLKLNFERANEEQSANTESATVPPKRTREKNTSPDERQLKLL